MSSSNNVTLLLLMKVVIASHNPAKIRAAEQAFSLQFSEKVIDFIPTSVESGVRDQPLSDEETRHGARNRAQNAHEQHSDADFWVGLEGGIETIDGQLMAFFSTVNSKRQGGAFGLLTNGIYTRESVYTEALVIALVPFVNALY
jgi:non-canonical (house-cleaning) NTP pyrophosphatase